VPFTEKQPELISIPLLNVDVEFPLTVRVLRRSPFRVEEPVMPRVAPLIPPVKVEVAGEEKVGAPFVPKLRSEVDAFKRSEEVPNLNVPSESAPKSQCFPFVGPFEFEIASCEVVPVSCVIHAGVVVPIPTPSRESAPTPSVVP
jgi:hypothetical protein